MKTKTVLVIGSGGREHALALKLSQSQKVLKVIVAPGNDLWSAEWERWPDTKIESQNDFSALAERACSAKVDLAVVGPDNPLAAGIVDVFTKFGIPCFGPVAAAAKLEASKSYAKEVMHAAQVPTARYFVAKSVDKAIKILNSLPWSVSEGWVLKVDGLALGKGVRVCETRKEAIDELEAGPIGKLLAVQGSLVIEERLEGVELSWMAFCDGHCCALLEPARDYKRLLDKNNGPNTGGMGAFSPVPGIPAAFTERVRTEVFEPVLREMEKRGAPFRGLLYAGLMVDIKKSKLWVLEFNVRFGDPETQVLLPRINDDLFIWCEASARGDLSGLPRDVPFIKDSAVVVVGAAKGYPDSPEKGKIITFQEGYENIFKQKLYYWAGVKLADGKPVTAGGRVVGALGLGSDLKEASVRAYQNLKQLRFAGMQFRSDVGADVASQCETEF